MFDEGLKLIIMYVYVFYNFFLILFWNQSFSVLKVL